MSSQKSEKRDPLVFDNDPALYDRARPDYPPGLFRAIVKTTRLRHGSSMLEIGCGTGKSTKWFARHGYRITAVEKGANLAAYASAKFSGRRNVTVVNSSFEDFKGDAGAYSLIYSGTAFHWLDRKIAYMKCASLLKEGGHIALFWIDHVLSDISRAQFAAIQEAYREYMPDWAAEFDLNGPNEMSEKRVSEINESGLFRMTGSRDFYFTVDYGPQDYIDLLSTYSDHAVLPEATKNGLFSRVASIIEEKCGGTLTKEYRASLYMAERL